MEQGGEGGRVEGGRERERRLYPSLDFLCLNAFELLFPGKTNSNKQRRVRERRRKRKNLVLQYTAVEMLIAYIYFSSSSSFYSLFFMPSPIR